MSGSSDKNVSLSSPYRSLLSPLIRADSHSALCESLPPFSKVKEKRLSSISCTELMQWHQLKKKKAVSICRIYGTEKTETVAAATRFDWKTLEDKYKKNSLLLLHLR